MRVCQGVSGGSGQRGSSISDGVGLAVSQGESVQVSLGCVT